MISRKGQTLIEALIALSVVTMGFLGIAALLSKSFFYNRVISDQLTATYLASEGLEVAKNLIDHDLFSNVGWGACFAPHENGNGVAELALDYTASDCTNIQNYVANMPLQFDPATNLYSYHVAAGSVASQFSRDVRVTVQGPQISVQSIVAWSTGPVTSRSVILEDHFYHWRK